MRRRWRDDPSARRWLFPDCPASGHFRRKFAFNYKNDLHQPVDSGQWSVSSKFLSILQSSAIKKPLELIVSWKILCNFFPIKMVKFCIKILSTEIRKIQQCFF
jgi:hypothetical protein